MARFLMNSMGYMLVGRKTSGKQVPPPGTMTLPGEVYKISFTIDNTIPITSFSKLHQAVTAVKRDYPMVNISAIEVVDNKVYIEYYDAPGVPWNLVMAAVVIVAATVLLVVLKDLLTWLIQAGREIVESPLLLILVLGVLVVAGVFGYGYIVNAPQRQGG